METTPPGSSLMFGGNFCACVRADGAASIRRTRVMCVLNPSFQNSFTRVLRAFTKH
jgi:hypothetical protein